MLNVVMLSVVATYNMQPAQTYQTMLVATYTTKRNSLLQLNKKFCNTDPRGVN
jgi:hypothetical protein